MKHDSWKHKGERGWMCIDIPVSSIPLLHTVIVFRLSPTLLHSLDSLLCYSPTLPPILEHMLRPWLRRFGAFRSPVCLQCRISSSRSRPHNLAYFPARSLQTSVHQSQDYIPLRQQLKREAKSLKSLKRQRKEDEEASRRKWELTVGIEIHAQLNTEAKLFSSQCTP